MRWIKHMTATWDDEKVARLIGEGGKDGLAMYGALWRVREIVAASMDGPTPSCSCQYSVTRWSLLMSLRGSLVGHYLEKMAVTGLLTADRDGSEIRVTIPNLLKFRDEYSRKSGHTPENIHPRIEQIQKEIQNKKEKKIKTPSRAKRTSGEVKHSTDPRHIACKEEIFAYYQAKNHADPEWDGMEGKALGMLLGAAPRLTAVGIKKLLNARARSEVNHADRPGLWIRSLGSYRAGPLDRFGKPLAAPKHDPLATLRFDNERVQ